MDYEQPFRLTLIVILGLLFPVAFFYRVRSQRTRERLDRRQEGWFVLLTLRATALVTLGALFAYMIRPGSVAWAHMPLPTALRWAGAPLAAAGAAWFVWTLHVLGPNLTDTVVVREKATLVTRGPYAVVRHPFYLGFAAIFLGAALLSANAVILAGGTIAFVLLVVRADTEEAKLEERFGDAYRAYAARTGRFFPRLH